MKFNPSIAIQLAKAHVNGASMRSLSMTFGLSLSEVSEALSQIFIPRDTAGYSSTSVRAKNQGLERDERSEGADR